MLQNDEGKTINQFEQVKVICSFLNSQLIIILKWQHFLMYAGAREQHD